MHAREVHAHEARARERHAHEVHAHQILLSRTYAFAAFGGRWPDVAFLILALNRQLGTLVPAALRRGRNAGFLAAGLTVTDSEFCQRKVEFSCMPVSQRRTDD